MSDRQNLPGIGRCCRFADTGVACPCGHAITSGFRCHGCGLDTAPELVVAALASDEKGSHTNGVDGEEVSP